MRYKLFSRAIAVAAIFMCMAVTASETWAQSSEIQQMLKAVSPQMLQQLGITVPGAPPTPAQTPQSPTTLTPVQPGQVSSGPSQLEFAMSRRVGINLTQFGYDQVGVGSSVTVPQTGAVQDDYVLGPGDQIQIILRGQENSEFVVSIDRNGQVLLPKTGPVMAAGKTFGQFRGDLAAAVQRSYVSTQSYVSVAQLRQVTVMVAGEVAVPGMRVLTGLSTPLDAILLSGGIQKTGSLRAISLIRQGHVIPVDLYGVLTKTGATRLPNLQDGDRILVPPIGATVAVAGYVRRPAIYELPAQQTVMRAGELLSLGNGVMLRGATTASVLRIMPNGTAAYADISGQMSSVVRDGEIVVFKAAVDVAVGRVKLVGAVRTPGAFALGNYKTLKKILPSPDALQPGAFVLFGIIDRIDPHTLQHVLVAFSPIRIIEGKEDVPLESEDTVYVLTQSDINDIIVATAANTSVNDLPPWAQLQQQGTTTNSGSQQTANTSQGGGSANGAPPAGTQFAQQLPYAQQLTYAQQLALAQSGAGQASVPGAPLAQTQGMIPNMQPGMVPGMQTAVPGIQPGAVPNTPFGATPNMQTSALPNMQPGTGGQTGAVPNTQFPATGMSPTALPGQSIGQQLAAEFGSRILEHRFNVSGAVQVPGIYFAAPNTTMAEALAVMGGFSADIDRSSFEVSSTQIDNDRGASTTVRKTYAATNEQLANLVIRPYDRIEFHHVYADRDSGTVSIVGEVRYPGDYNVLRAERLSSVLMRAGGLTEVAYPYGTIFLRKSVADIETQNKKKAVADIRSALFAALVRPQSANQAAPSAEAIAGLQTLLNQVEGEPSLGRISIEADPAVLAAHPERDPILQPGDQVVIPKRPSSVSVLGEVMRPGAFPLEHGRSADDYIDQAGGYTEFADEDRVIIVLPDGRARVKDSGWLSFGGEDLPPGTVVVVARDITGLTMHQLVMDTTQILSQMATTTASLAVLATRVNN